MRLEQYKVKFNTTKTAFEFISEEPKGDILKGVYYSKMKVRGFRNVYNLAFGDKLLNSDNIDDSIITDNQDRDKVLATVANTLIAFTKRHPKAQIYIEGSNDVRTRLYQMAISKYFDELSDTFDIKGIIENRLVPFDKKINYSSFLICRKIK